MFKCLHCGATNFLMQHHSGFLCCEVVDKGILSFMAIESHMATEVK